MQDERDLAKTVGIRIRALRAEHGWNQVDLEAHLDNAVKRATLSDYETGRRLPSLRTLSLLARAFNVEVASLFLNPHNARHRVASAVLQCKPNTLEHVAKLLDVTITSDRR